jgi:tetratricopeptide (TPR) repeat protein
VPRTPRLLAAALALLVGAGPAWADPPPAPPPAGNPDDLGTPPAEAGSERSMQWVDGFAAAAAKARATGKILFVLVTQDSPPCPACRGLKARVFAKPDAARISDAYVAARLVVGDGATPEAEAFRERYGIESYPALLAMTADGALLSRIRTFAQDRPLGTDDFLEALAEASKHDTDFQARRGELLAKDDTAAWAEVVKSHVDRMEYATARDVHRKILAKEPTVDNHGMLAYLSKQAGDVTGARATLETMLSTFPDHPERIEWRIRLATIDLGSTGKGEDELVVLVDRHVAALEKLLAAVEAEGNLSDQAEVRTRLANMLAQKDDHANVARHLQWVAENDPDGRRAPGARLALAYALYQRGDLEPAIAHLETILAKHPGSPQAKEAKDVLPDLKKELAEKNKKKP